MPWVSYGQKEGTTSSGGWMPYGTKKKQDKKKAIIEESLAKAKQYQEEADKYSGRANTIEGIGKTIVRPFVSLAEIPKNVYGSATGKQNTFGDVNVPVLGKVQSYQEESKGVTGDILEGRKPLYSILKPMGSAVIDTAGLGIGSSAAKGVTKEAFKQTAKRLIPEGAAYGLGQGVVDSIGDGRSYGEKAKGIATSTAFGAIGAPLLGVGFNVIGRAVSALGSKLSGRATKVLEPTEVKDTVDEIAGIVDRDLKPEEESVIMESLSKGAAKDEIITEVGKAKISEGLNPKVRLSQVVDEIESGGRKLSLEEVATVKKGLEEGKSLEEIQTSTTQKKETSTETPDNGDEAFLKSVEERFLASKREKFREATKDKQGRFTGSKSEARMAIGDPERDALSESIQKRLDLLGKDDLNKTTQENFYDTSQSLRLEDIQNQIPQAKAEDLPRLKQEADDIIQEILDKRAGEFKAASKREDRVQKAMTIANNSNTPLEFRINLRKEGMDKSFKSQQAAEEFYRRTKGGKYRLANQSDSEQPLLEEARKYKSAEEFVKESEKQLENWIPKDSSYRLGSVPIEDTHMFPAKKYSKFAQDGNDKSLEYWRNRIKNGGEITPIVVEPGNFKTTNGSQPWYVRDGLHRLAAAEEAGIKNIPALIIGKKSDRLSREFRKAKPGELTSQLTDIWNKANENPLTQEAKKYKSAEEFLKAQPNKWLHGTPASFDEFDLKHFGKSDDGFAGKGVYLTNDPKSARYFADEWTSKAYPNKRIGNVMDVYPDIKKPLIVDNYNDIFKKLGIREEKGLNVGESTKKYKDIIPEKAQNLGYDSIIIRSKYPDGTPADELVVFQTDNIKTKSQLIDIWNKANEGKFRSEFGDRFEQLTGTKITPEQEANIKALHKKMFGDESVEVTAQILTPNGQKALGEYKSKIIKILDGQVDPEDTFYHEAVHKYLDLFTSMDEQKKIYLEARKLWKTDNLDDLEEKIAENFIRYAKTNEGVVGTMKVLFDKVVDRIKSALKGESSIEALYKDILEGKAAKSEKAPITSKELQRRIAALNKKVREKEREMKKEPEPMQKTKEATLDASVKQIVPKGKKVSIIAERLNKDLPPDFRIDETYDPKAINKEADKAAELIANNKTKAIQKALDTDTNPMERDAILIELSEIAKRDGDYGTLSDLFNRRSELIRSGAQSLNMEKASILLNPQEKYMRDVVNAKLGKVKIRGKELTLEEVAKKRTGIRREVNDAVRKSFKIEDAQELFDKLLCT